MAADGQSKVDLFGLNAIALKQVKRASELHHVGVGVGVGAGLIVLNTPGPVNVVVHDVEPVDVISEILHIKALKVLEAVSERD